jgi:hypothetical protein
VELITTGSRNGKPTEQAHYVLTTLRTIPKAMLRLVRQHRNIGNEWHWVRDVQLGQDAHRYANRVGAPLFSFLRTVVMNLLRRGGFHSIHAGQKELAHDISRPGHRREHGCRAQDAVWPSQRSLLSLSRSRL